MTLKERKIIQSISPYDGKYDEAVNPESAAEILAQKALDAAETAKEVEEKGEEKVRERSRKSTSMWEKAGKAALGAAASSAATMLARKALGKKSSADPIATGLSAFARNIFGGLMR